MRATRSYRFPRSLRLVVVFALFQKGEKYDPTTTIDIGSDEDERPGRIRCPACTWQPRASDLWYCGDCAEPERFFGGCGAAWNTFETRGLCPGCGHLWRHTACLVCGAWSLHDEWYERDGR